jgi:hypothetical protein
MQHLAVVLVHLRSEYISRASDLRANATHFGPQEVLEIAKPRIVNQNPDEHNRHRWYDGQRQTEELSFGHKTILLNSRSRSALLDLRSSAFIGGQN